MESWPRSYAVDHRGRFVYPLKAYDGEQLVLITVDLGPLPTGAGFINDGLQKNHNELYRRVPKQAETAPISSG